MKTYSVNQTFEDKMIVPNNLFFVLFIVVLKIGLILRPLIRGYLFKITD
jgi:hypothetical protein